MINFKICVKDMHLFKEIGEPLKNILEFIKLITIAG